MFRIMQNLNFWSKSKILDFQIFVFHQDDSWNDTIFAQDFDFVVSPKIFEMIYGNKLKLWDILLV